jgi:deoxyribonuclease-4
MEPVRVRSVLSSLRGKERTALKKLLPKKLEVPEVEKAGKYPNALLQVLNSPEKYSYLGCIAETMLRGTEMTYEELIPVVESYKVLTEADKAKLKKSKTTDEFLESLRVTRERMDAVMEGDEYEIEAEVGISGGKGVVVGHPDFRTKTQIFEVKLTGQLKQNWQDFLFQTFAYASLDTNVKEVCIVLPLQETVWRYNVEKWNKRDEYRKYLEDKVGRRESEATMYMMAMILMGMYRIGNHISKQKQLHNTIDTFPSYERPYQIFLSGPQNSNVNIGEEDLKLTRSKVEKYNAKLYIHSPYLINLCQEPGSKDDFHVELLRKNLEYAVKAGAKGVVVHVGKSCGREEGKALENMYENVMKVLEYATEDCPLLLETPAGQGTETLTKYEEFLEFVELVDDKRFGICVDTCHVYACGHDPLEYITKLITSNKKPKLIHYNDSEGCCGSCVDRHAMPGAGKIGYEKMEAIAKRVSIENIDALYE